VAQWSENDICFLAADVMKDAAWVQQQAAQLEA